MAINPHRRGGTDVPVGDGGTGASSGAAGLANLGGLDETAHDLLDHTGLTGIPGATAPSFALSWSGLAFIVSPSFLAGPGTDPGHLVPPPGGFITDMTFNNTSAVPATATIYVGGAPTALVIAAVAPGATVSGSVGPLAVPPGALVEVELTSGGSVAGRVSILIQ